MECNFYVGQEVICVNADPNTPPNDTLSGQLNGDLDGLKVGNHYTVSGLYLDHRFSLPCITVKEIFRGHNAITNTEHGYFAFRFKPVKKTDISDLVKLLEPFQKTKELVD